MKKSIPYLVVLLTWGLIFENGLRYSHAEEKACPSSLEMKFLGVLHSYTDLTKEDKSIEGKFRIGVSGVTTEQYSLFLNAIAATDTHHLYHASGSINAAMGGIVRMGTPGSYSYSVLEGYEEMPITEITWFDAARFCNWLHNNEPTGEQNRTTTEVGAYTLSEELETRAVINPEALYFLPTSKQRIAFYSVKGSQTNSRIYSPVYEWNSSLNDAFLGEATEVIDYKSSTQEGITFSAEIDPALCSTALGFRIATPWGYSSQIESLANVPNKNDSKLTDYPSPLHLKQDLEIHTPIDFARVTAIAIFIAAIAIALGLALGAWLAPLLTYLTGASASTFFTMEQLAIVSGGTAVLGPFLRDIGKINKLSTPQLVGLFFAVMGVAAPLSMGAVAACGLYGAISTAEITAKILSFTAVGMGELSVATLVGWFFGIL